jgi:hypothetical protein
MQFQPQRFRFTRYPYDRGGIYNSSLCDVIETKSTPPRYLLELRMLLPGRQLWSTKDD